MAPFYGWGSTASRLEPLRGGSLLFTTFYYFSRQIYEANLFNKNFKNFNTFLTILKCSVELDFEFNVTVYSCKESNFYVLYLYCLVQFIRFKA